MATATLAVLAVLSLVVLVLALGLLSGEGHKQLNTPLAISNDGPRVGRPAPRATIETISGDKITVPNGTRQILLFADHSLMEFDDLLPWLASEPADPPGLVVVGSMDRTSAALLAGLGLGVPTAVVPHAIYDRYRIRVMPYAVVIDASGRVVTSGLVNTPFQVRHLAQVGLAVEAPAPPTGRPS